MSFLKKTPYTFDSIIRSIISLLLIIGIIILLRVLRFVLLPFAIGFILSYIINPLISFIERKVSFVNRAGAVIIGLSFITTCITTIGVMMYPLISNEINQAAIIFQSQAQKTNLLSIFPQPIEETIRVYLNSKDFKSLLEIENIKSLCVRNRLNF